MTYPLSVISNNDLAAKIGNLAIQAMMYEVSCFPAPGLVSPVSAGAHTDMDYFTFIDSTCVLSRYFPVFAAEGLEGLHHQELFRRIRAIGVGAEQEMFQKTKGVNTHKGMLFLLGICCAAVGKVLHEKQEFKDIPEVIQEMTAGIVKSELGTEDLKEKANLSHGEKLFLKYKVLGVRAEVEEGIPTVFNHSLKFYEECAELKTNDRLVHTLIGIMQICEDTTIIHRHSPETLREVQAKAKGIIAAGGMRTRVGRMMINVLQDDFIVRNISPGGSADLLGITVFLSLIREELF